MPQYRIFLQCRKLSWSVVDQEDLHQQRCTGKQCDIGANQPHQHRRFQRQDDGENQRQHQSNYDGGDRQRQAGMQPFQQFR